jgi:hypothetical protein
MVEGIRSTETSVLTRATCRNIPEDGILNKLILLVSERKEQIKEADFNELDMLRCVPIYVFVRPFKFDINLG